RRGVVRLAAKARGPRGSSRAAGRESESWCPAGLLLRVAGEADVHGQLAGRRQLRGRLGEHVELALVVDDAPAEEPAVALGERERIRVPELERIRRLDVDVAVDEHRDARAVRRR